MNVHLQTLDGIDFQDSERQILNVLQATLEYPADATLKAAKLAHDIEFFCNATEGPVEADGTLWDIWSVMIELISIIPPAHPWQDSLIQAAQLLRQEGKAIPHLSHSNSWTDLPKLSLCVRENWGDPTFTVEDLPDEFAKWQSFTSFVARLTTNEFQPWLNLAIDQLRIGLEEEAVAGSPMDCRIWVATEWIIRCGKVIFEDMGSTYALDQGVAKSYRTGPLAGGVPLKSPERWQLWKRRLGEISMKSGTLRLTGETEDRIRHALHAMAEVDRSLE